MMIERRHRRSSQRGPALDHQLSACRDAGGLDAIVVGDADGLVVAAAGAPELCAELAARGAAQADALSFPLDGTRLAVIARGGTAAARQRELARAAAGAHRILAG